MKDELTIMDAEQLRALGHPLRLRVLDALSDGDELTNRELASRLGVDPGHLHFHVRLLHRAGLIERCESRGRREKPYRIAASTFRVAPELASSGLARDAQAAVLASVERAWSAYAAAGRFRSAQLTVRVRPDQLSGLLRELAERAAVLEDRNTDPLVVTLFAHPPAPADEGD